MGIKNVVRKLSIKRVISTFKFGYRHLTLKEGTKVISDHTKRFPADDFLWLGLPSQNITSQDFVMRNISGKFEISTYNTLCSRGPTKVLAESQKKTVAAILFFKMRPNRQYFMVMNTSCKFEKASYNFFFVRAVTVKSLYTLQRRNKIHCIHPDAIEWIQ